jgi:RimJ/RimL family protein N-acetyltransferase
MQSLERWGPRAPPLYNRTVRDGAVIETPRLSLRRWREADLAPFARINADPRVMEFFPKCLSRRESDAVVDRIHAHFARHGFGLYAAELRQNSRFIGFIGLAVPSFVAHLTPCVEIGWRLEPESWGLGLATEGAGAVAAYAFEALHTPELVSMAVAGNVRSTRVMEKIGMTRDPADDFDHPSLPPDHPLRRHVLYRLKLAPGK